MVKIPCVRSLLEVEPYLLCIENNDPSVGPIETMVTVYYGFFSSIMSYSLLSCGEVLQSDVGVSQCKEEPYVY